MIKLAIAMTLLSGCTDAQWDKYASAYNEQHDVECWSGGQVIFRAKTTGKVEEIGEGWSFRTTDGRFVQTFADCFVSFKK